MHAAARATDVLHTALNRAWHPVQRAILEKGAQLSILSLGNPTISLKFQKSNPPLASAITNLLRKLVGIEWQRTEPDLTPGTARHILAAWAHYNLWTTAELPNPEPPAAAPPPSQKREPTNAAPKPLPPARPPIRSGDSTIAPPALPPPARPPNRSALADGATRPTGTLARHSANTPVNADTHPVVSSGPGDAPQSVSGLATAARALFGEHLNKDSVSKLSRILAIMGTSPLGTEGPAAPDINHHSGAAGPSQDVEGQAPVLRVKTTAKRPASPAGSDAASGISNDVSSCSEPPTNRALRRLEAYGNASEYVPGTRELRAAAKRNGIPREDAAIPVEVTAPALRRIDIAQMLPPGEHRHLT